MTTFPFSLEGKLQKWMWFLPVLWTDNKRWYLEDDWQEPLGNCDFGIWKSDFELRKRRLKHINLHDKLIYNSIYYDNRCIRIHLEAFGMFHYFLSKSFKSQSNWIKLHPRHSNRQAFPIRASAASCAMRLEPNALVARERCSGAAQSTKAAQCMMMSLELHNLR